jgi:hypothetical protein
MAIRLSRSATPARHSIAHSRARYVVEHCPWPLYSPAPDDADIVVLGPDPDGVPLEVIGLELASGDLLVIHAMKLREKYRADYERVMRCQGQ